MKDNRAYYDVFAKSYEDARGSRYHRYLDDSEMALVGPHARGKDVLEVGCGTGLILERLAAQARSARGIDLSAGMLEKARARGLDVVEGDATALPFEDASFDLVCSFKVLAHVPDLAAAFSEMARVLRPGGVMVAEVYNAVSARALVKRLKPPTRIGAGGTHDQDVYTRYDHLDDVLDRLPPTVIPERVDGIRVLSPVALPFAVPGFGAAWQVAEQLASRSPLKRFGGFLVVTARKRATPDGPGSART